MASFWPKRPIATGMGICGDVHVSCISAPMGLFLSVHKQQCEVFCAGHACRILTAVVPKGWNAVHADHAIWEAANLSFCTQDNARMTRSKASLSKWIPQKAVQLRRLQYVDSPDCGFYGKVRTHGITLAQTHYTPIYLGNKWPRGSSVVRMSAQQHPVSHSLLCLPIHAHNSLAVRITYVPISLVRAASGSIMPAVSLMMQLSVL